MNTGESFCEDCGHELCCCPDEPAVKPMTSPAIQLARECGGHSGGRIVTFTHEELETFYAKAQAQALRDAARMWSIYGTITTDHGSETTEVCRSDNLLRTADDLERKA